MNDAREAARHSNGKFGTHQLNENSISGIPRTSAPEPLDTVPGPVTWTLDLAYNDGGEETITGDSTGTLPAPHRSERLMLTQLLGFKKVAFNPGIDLQLADALESPGAVVEMHPVFDTTQGSPTTVYGRTTSFTISR
jgi:hypothetical protein